MNRSALVLTLCLCPLAASAAFRLRVSPNLARGAAPGAAAAPTLAARASTLAMPGAAVRRAAAVVADDRAVGEGVPPPHAVRSAAIALSARRPAPAPILASQPLQGLRDHVLGPGIEPGSLAAGARLHEAFGGARPMGLVSASASERDASPSRPASALEAARDKLYALAGGSLDSGRPELSRLDSARLLEFIRSKEFKGWVASEKAQGKVVFWLTDLDKTMAAGDIFTFYFDWRARHGGFSRRQNRVLKDFLQGTGLLDRGQMRRVERNGAAANAKLVLELWRRKEEGGKGISLLDLWLKAYWPSQMGLAREQKTAQLAAFAPEYARQIFPGIPEQNAALREAGVQVVLVSNGDEELARAVAPLLNIPPKNTVGAELLYDERGRGTGKMSSYEQYDAEWSRRPQAGKALTFRLWVQQQRARWPGINRDKISVAAMLGDSPAADGGAMVHLNPALGFFMVNTPGEPKRRENFVRFAHKYGGALGRGSFITVDYAAPPAGAIPGDAGEGLSGRRIISEDRAAWAALKDADSVQGYVLLDASALDAAMRQALAGGASEESLQRVGSPIHQLIQKILAPIEKRAARLELDLFIHYSVDAFGSTLLVEFKGTKRQIVQAVGKAPVAKAWLGRSGSSLRSNHLLMRDAGAFLNAYAGVSTVYLKRGVGKGHKVGSGQIDRGNSDEALPVYFEAIEEMPYSKVDAGILNGLAPGLSWEEMLSTMQGYYPGFTSDDPVTVIRYRRR